VEKDMVAYWSFDEGEGDLAHDYSGNENNIQVAGVKWVDGICGKALLLDERSSLICGGGLELCFVFSNDYSIEAWVKHESKGRQIYVSKWSGSRLESAWVIGYFDGTLQFTELYGEGRYFRLSGPDVADGKWHYIVGVRKGKNLQLYVDGSKVAEGESEGKKVGDNIAPLRVGSFGAGRISRWPLIGFMDEVRVYSRALTEDEIRKRYQIISSRIKEPTLKPLPQEMPLMFYVGGVIASLYEANKPIEAYLNVVASKPVPLASEKIINMVLRDKDGSIICKSEETLLFEKGEKIKVLSISALPRREGTYHVEVGIDGEVKISKIASVINLDSIVAENIRIKGERAKTNPFYRGIVSAYAGMIYKQDYTPDIDAILSLILDLNVNCYTYLIHGHSEKELATLGEFCSRAREHGIEVWVYIVPPSEALPGYPPFNLDYIKWAEEIARISVQNPNLTLWMIDDFDGNLSFFTVDYTKQIYSKTKEVNPNLLFGVCVYHESLNKFSEAGYLPYVDALLWGYQHSSFLYPECGIYPNTLPLEINDYLKTGKIAIPCIYFTPHSSWPINRPLKEYLRRAIEIAYEQAGICWVFTTPRPGTFQYDVVKEFTSTCRLPKRRW